MEKHKLITNVFLAIIIILLLGIIFKDKIYFYFKAQEVLKRADALNSIEVASYCVKGMMRDEEDLSDTCLEKLDEYRSTDKKYRELVRQYRDLDCSDFESSEDAKDFFHWESGEMALSFYRSHQYRKDKKGEEPIEGAGFMFFKLYESDGECRYDPYNLDSDSDCNACERVD